MQSHTFGSMAGSMVGGTAGSSSGSAAEAAELSTLFPRSTRNDWREIAVRATTRGEADALAASIEENGYSGIFLVSPARASARLVDRWGRVFRIGSWPRDEEPPAAAHAEPPVTADAASTKS